MSDYPTFQEQQAMWDELSVSVEPTDCAPMLAYVDALRGVNDNGTVIYRCFQFAPHPVFQALWNNQLQGDLGVLCSILHLPDVIEALGTTPYERWFQKHFYQSSSFTMQALLADTLYHGGPYFDYKNRPLTGIEVKQLADSAVHALNAGQYDEATRCFHTTHAWSSFFADVAWDHTWVISQLPQNCMHIIISTDTD